jgi:hypothetical protein
MIWTGRVDKPEGRIHQLAGATVDALRLSTLQTFFGMVR